MSSEPSTAQLALPVEGMTCASCVNRIERFLKRTPGVEDAVVNLATEVATIRYVADQVGRAELVGAIEAAGYDVRPIAVDAPAPAAGASELEDAAIEAARDKETRDLLVRAGLSIAVAVGIMA